MTKERRDWLRKPLTSIAAFFLVVPMLVTAAVVGVTVATRAAHAADAASFTVPSRDAYIYDAFDAWDNSDTQGTYTSLDSLLKQEGYKVRELEATATGPGSAKISELAKLYKAGILILSGHAGSSGQDLELYGQCAYVTETSTSLDCAQSSDGVVDPQWKKANKAAKKYAKIYGANAVGVQASPYDVYNHGHFVDIVPRWVVYLTADGLRQIFTKGELGIVVNDGCNSKDLSSDFNADSYFGHSACTDSGVNNSDLNVLFQRDLSGANGLVRRSTLGVIDTGPTGFSPIFQADPSAVANSPLSVTLSPAVDSVSPLPGGTVSTVSAAAVVDFDTEMNTSINPSQIVSVKGCGASIDSEEWGSATAKSVATWDADLTIPANETGTLTFTVHSHFAKSKSPADIRLDGNQSPSPQNGEAPNGTDYVWTAKCDTTNPSPPTPTLDNVEGAPNDPIGASCCGYNESQQPVTGSGFIRNESVTLSIEGNAVGSGTTDNEGNLATTITIPQEPDATYPLEAEGEGGDQATAELISTGSSFEDSTDTCDSSTEMYTVDTNWDGAGLDADSTYTFTLSTGDSFTAQTDLDGAFSTSFTEMVQAGDSPTADIMGPFDGGTGSINLGPFSYGDFPDC